MFRLVGQCFFAQASSSFALLSMHALCSLCSFARDWAFFCLQEALDINLVSIETDNATVQHTG